MARLYMYLEGRADMFADEVCTWYKRKRKVKEDPILVNPSDWLETQLLQGGSVASGHLFPPSMIYGKFDG